MPMPRKRFVIVALVCLAAVGGLATPWALSTGGIGDRLSREFARETGLTLTTKGRATIAFLPVPRVKIEDVAFASSSGEPLAHARSLRGDIRILSLLAGRIEVSGLHLYEPRMNATWDGSSVGGVGDIWRRFTNPATLSSGQLERISLIGGGASLRTASGDVIGEARNINVVITPPTRDSGTIASGSVTWGHETFTLTFAGAAPALMATPKGGPVTFNLTSGLASLAFTGISSLVGDTRYVGTLAAETRSLRDLGHLMQIDMPFGDAVGPMAVQGQASLSARGLDIATARIKLNSDVFEGALSARIDNGRPALSGTLDAASLDLGLLFSDLSPLRTNDGHWRRDTIDWNDMAVADLDLRISAAAGRLGALRLSDLALGVLLNNGKLELNLSRATAYRGTVRGRMSLTPLMSPVAATLLERLDLKASLSLDRVDAGALMTHLGRSRMMTGLTHGQFAIDASGQSMAEMVQSANGKLGLILRQGELIGVNFGDALRAADRRPLSAAIDWRGGRSAFEQASITAGIRNGVAEITAGTLTATTFKGTLAGFIGLSDQVYNLRGMLTGLAGGREGPTLPMTISGPWDNPVVLPDVRALIQRSMPASSLVARPPALSHPQLGNVDTLNVRADD